MDRRFKNTSRRVYNVIRNRERWEHWESQYIRATPVDFERNLQAVESLYAHAAALNVLERRDPLAGLDTIVYLAKVVNV